MTSPVMPQKTADTLRALARQAEAIQLQIQAAVLTAADLLGLDSEHWTYDIPSGSFVPNTLPGTPADDPSRLG